MNEMNFVFGYLIGMLTLLLCQWVVRVLNKPNKKA